jgi:hypothetical protein
MMLFQLQVVNNITNVMMIITCEWVGFVSKCSGQFEVLFQALTEKFGQERGW